MPNVIKPDSSRKITTKSLIIVLSAVCIVLICGVLFRNVVDYLQVQEIGRNYISMFWANFNIKMFSLAFSFIIFFLSFFITLVFVAGNMAGRDEAFYFLKRKTFIALVCFIFAFVASSFTSDNFYSKLLLFMNSTPFNRGDPVFFRDIGYYIFQRPLFVALIDQLMGIAILQFVVATVLYAFLYARFDVFHFKNILKEKGIMSHMVINIAIAMIIKAFSYKFAAEDILFSRFNGLAGAGFTNIAVWMKYCDIMPFLMVAIVVAVLVFLHRSQYKKMLLALTAFPLAFVITLAAAGIVQSVVVSSNEKNVEKNNIKYNIDFTRLAYNITNFDTVELIQDNKLTAKDIEDNSVIFNNIPIGDTAMALLATNQLQSVRNYYKFFSMDTVQYKVNGANTLVKTSAREIDKGLLDSQQNSYNNKKMIYTHGMGAVVNPVNKITEKGYPFYVVRDVPTRSFDGAPQIKQPRIYYGEQPNDYLIVNTLQREVDVSDTEAASEFSYDGQSGLFVNVLNRLLFSMENGDMRLLFSNDVHFGSKILPNTNIISRVKKIAPFLQYDPNPYILVDDAGRLKWVIDAYTTSEYYPYAQSYVSLGGSNYNYIRNSVRVIVDAYDGSTTFYLIDQTDPIAASYKRIYPQLFSQAQMPEELASHMRYPQYLFQIQSTVLRKYNTANTDSFFDKQNLWDAPNEKFSDLKNDFAPYDIMAKIGDGFDFVTMTPYLQAGKDNIVAWLTVNNDPSKYGKLTLTKLQQGTFAPGFGQVNTNINNNSDVSKELAQLKTSSKVTRGDITAIPVKNSIIYVEPVYVSSQNSNAAPQLARIIVAFDNNVVIEQTLDAALAKLFGTTREVVTSILNNDVDAKQLTQDSIDVFAKIKQAAQQGNWELFGNLMKQLEDNVNLLHNKLNPDLPNPPQTSASPQPSAAGGVQLPWATARPTPNSSAQIGGSAQPSASPAAAATPKPSASPAVTAASKPSASAATSATPK